MKSGEKMRDVFVKRRQLIQFLAMRRGEEVIQKERNYGMDIYYQGQIDGQIRAFEEIMRWLDLNQT